MNREKDHKEKLFVRIAALLLIAFLVVALLPARQAQAAGNRYLDDVLGISRQALIKQLEKHENDRYYNATPFLGGDNRNAYGNPRYRDGSSDIRGVAGFNCTGFVWRALVDAGANYKRIPVMMESPNCWQNSKRPGHNSWWNYLIGDAGFKPVYYRYYSVGALLADGRAEKGDIIFMSNTGVPSRKSGIIDSHVGFFWGDSPSDNKFWHSGPTTDHGAYYKTGITTINACSPSTYYLIKFAPSKNTGWKKTEKGWTYRYVGVPYKNSWAKINNNWYLFNKEAVMKTGWHVSSNGNKFYFNSSGKMVTGWNKIGGKWYYMSSQGDAATGWRLIGGKYYFFTSNGVMKTGWHTASNGNKFYFKSSGAMATGTVKISGKTYRFSSSGALIK